MRHGKKFNKLGRTASHRKHMLSNMAASLITHKRINTTVPKAKALRKYVEPLITRSKTDNTHSRRVVFRYLQDKDAVNELFRDVAPKVAERPGGYVRIIRLGSRQGDDAEMCMMELVDYNELMLADKQEQQKSGSGKRRRRRRGGKKKSSGSQQGGQEGAAQASGTEGQAGQEEQTASSSSSQEGEEQGAEGGTETASSDDSGSSEKASSASSAESGQESDSDSSEAKSGNEGKDDSGNEDEEKGNDEKGKT
jgi:large subunit ribosomal protein L17